MTDAARPGQQAGGQVRAAAQPVHLRRESSQPDQFGAIRGQCQRQCHLSRRADVRYTPTATERSQELRLRYDTSFRFETEVTQNGQSVQAYPMWPAAFRRRGHWRRPTPRKDRVHGRWQGGAAGCQEGERRQHLRGPFNWAGPQDQFFAAIFLPDNPDTAAMVTLHNSITVPKDPKKPDPNEVVHYEVLGAAVGDTSGVTQRAPVCRPEGARMCWSRCAPAPRPGR